MSSHGRRPPPPRPPSSGARRGNRSEGSAPRGNRFADSAAPGGRRDQSFADSAAPGARHQRPKKPALVLQPTTLWEYPSQHYGQEEQGDKRYVGATPSYVIWNVIQRYTQPGELVVDPMCGSGTTLDVARDTQRKGRGFDLAPFRPDIEQADARKLPLENEVASLVFIDPPYGDHIHYSEDPACIGKLSPFDDRYYREMGRVLREAARVLRPGGTLGLYVCDFYLKKQGFAPVGFALFDQIAQLLSPIDIVAVVRHNRTLGLGNYRKAAEEQNFFLRGFNYLFIAEKATRGRARPAAERR